MKTLITYSSLTGNTKRLAEGIFEGLQTEDKILLPMQELGSLEEFDQIFVGFWVDKGMPNEEAKKFLESLSGKTIGVFGTLAYWPDSKHASDSIHNAAGLAEEKNKILFRYICQGSLSQKMIDVFKTFEPDSPHALTPEKLKRYTIAERHPSKTDILAAVELVNERIESQYV